MQKIGFPWRARLLSAAAFLVLSACGSRELHVAAPASFKSIESLSLGPKCVQCHQTLSTYAGVMQIVTAGNPSASKLYQQVSSGDMPKQSTKLSDSEIAAISSWIQNGAAND